MLYLIIVIGIVLCFVIKRLKIQSPLLLTLFKRLHLFLSALLLLNILLMVNHWQLAGSYTNQYIILVTLLTGMFSYVFLHNSQENTNAIMYFGFLFRTTVVVCCIGIIPIISGYGGAFVFQLASKNYTTYGLKKSFYLRTIKLGVNNCFDLVLYQRFFLLEHQIPIYLKGKEGYECFNEITNFEIAEPEGDVIKTLLISNYNTVTTYMDINAKTQKLDILRQDYNGSRNYHIQF